MTVPDKPARRRVWRMPSHTFTKDEHDELVAERNGRPLTFTEPIHKRDVDTPTPHTTESLIDGYLAEHRRDNA